MSNAADREIRQFREVMHDPTASRLARIEAFKAVFLVLAFLAIGFAGGVYYVKSQPTQCQPVWWSI